MFVDGPSDKNPANMNPQLSSANTPEQKDSGSIFDKLFGGKSHFVRVLDTNSDGSISINEVEGYIQSSNSSKLVTKFISIFLGIKYGENEPDFVPK